MKMKTEQQKCFQCRLSFIMKSQFLRHISQDLTLNTICNGETKANTAVVRSIHDTLHEKKKHSREKMELKKTNRSR